MNFRRAIALDGTWQFQHDSQAQLTIETLHTIPAWREAQVPLPWQAQFADLRYTSGVAWYRRTFPVADIGDNAAILKFGAVDYHATVWVNGQRVGEHEGGYLPFEFDITALLHFGENEVAVCVVDPTDDAARWPAYPFREIPHGKQSWYGPISGIWQSVTLEVRPPVHLHSLRLTPHVAEKAVDLHLRYGGETLPDTAQVQIEIYAPSGAQVSNITTAVQTAIKLQVDEVQLWTPDTPLLYRVQVTLLLDGQPVDTLSATCGFRIVEARDGRIYLNGHPIYLRGVLDQAYYPKTIYTPPSLEFLEDQARKAKALGLNCLRCHIKIEDPRYYEVADRLGLLIWTEIPNWSHLSAHASQRAKETFLQMVERDWNHPSIIAWTLINENWGTDLARNPEHRAWLAEFYHEAKKVDPYRLIVDNSACGGNFHVAGDLDDFHDYKAIPDHAAQWDAWVADFANRAAWAWAEDYAQERRPGLPLLVSEFGNWGLPNPDNLAEDGRDPWWFETGHEWGEGIVYPHGMKERFAFWHLGDVFGDLASFTRAHQEHMARSLAYEINTMRLHEAIAGYVITEFTDVHWECNGLMDMQRNIKHGLETHFTPLNQDRVIAIRPQQWSGRLHEVLLVELRTLGVDGAESNGVIRWQAGAAQGQVTAPGGKVQIPLLSPGITTLKAQWRDGAGSLLAVNQVELTCVTPPTAEGKLLVLDDPALAATLSKLGYTIVTEAEEDVITVTHHYTQALQDAAQKGARLLLLAGPDFNQGENRARLPGCGLTARAGTSWQGDWATSFSWLKKQGPFAALPGSPLLEMECAELMPDAVITGLPAWVYRNQSWAGLALGWIHKPASLLARIPYGDGSIVVTTFKLTSATLGSNVIAQTIFQGLLAL